MPGRSTLFLVLLGIAGSVYAEPTPRDDTLDAAPEPDWRAADAGIDHRLTLPSAETLHQGELGLNDYGEGRPRE